MRKLLLTLSAILLVLASTMGASGGCGSTEKHKIRKQPVYEKCVKGYTHNSRGKCVKKKPRVQISCRKNNHIVNCKK